MEKLKWELYYDNDKNEFIMVIGKLEVNDDEGYGNEGLKTPA